MRGAGLVLLAAALALGTPALAQAPAPQLLQGVTAGFDGGASRDHPSPVWVTLVNQGERAERFTLAAISGAARSEVQVELPAGARRRVCLAVRLRGEVLVQLEREGEVLERRRIERITRLDPRRQLLSIDGRPPERRKVAGSRRGDPSLLVTAIEQADAPTEAACYEAFGAVLLRGVDLEAWDRDQRGALLEFAAQGGTLILGGVQPGRVEQVGLLRRLGSSPKRVKLLGLPAREHRYGLGRVLTFRDDVLLLAFQAGAKSAQAKQDLGDLVQSGQGRVRFAPTFQTYEGGFPEHPASTSQALVGGFLLVYLLAVGPVLAFAFRRSSRRKLALAAAIGIAGFSLLAFVVAGLVRVGAGVVFANEVVFVPRSGPALHVSDLTVVSGGASRYRLEVEGPEELAATVLPAATGVYVDRWRPQRTRQLRAARTRRGKAVSMQLSMPLWGQQSVSTLSVVPDVRPLKAELRKAGAGYEVRVENTTGRPLEQALVIERGIPLSKYTGYSELGTLQPGEVKVVPVFRNARLRVPRKRLDELCWSAKLGVPETWTAWTKLVEPRGRRSALDFMVVSVIPARLTVKGPNLRPAENALRIDPVVTEPGLERGYMGLVLEEGNRVAGMPSWVEVRINRVLAGSPAAKAGIVAGMHILQLDNISLRSPKHLRTEVGRHLPGETIRLGVTDPTTGRYRTVRIRLGSRQEVPTGD